MKWLFSIFSPYAHPFERRVNHFFKSIQSTSNPVTVHRTLQELMQENLVVVNLWMEKKYKNYVHLKKRTRRKMYANVEILKNDFLTFAGRGASALPPLRSPLDRLNLAIPDPSHSEPFLHLAAIMAYLKPGGRYEYQASANFGKLLKNPHEEKLIGDCNQIVTLYTYLYSLKFPISDLKIKILPRHVCLHFEGIDIEATSGTFQNYPDKADVLPITELLSTNLLDISDAEAKTATIDPRTMVKRAQLAYHLSSFRHVVARNLNAAYERLIVTLLDQKNYRSAIFFAEKRGDPDWIKQVYSKATAEALRRNDFSEAEHYLRRSGDEAMREIFWHNQGVYYYKRGQYDQALTFFQKANNTDMVKACCQQQYANLSKRVQGVKTLAEAKRHRSTYQKMLTLARSGDMEKAAESMQKILRQF